MLMKALNNKMSKVFSTITFNLEERRIMQKLKNNMLVFRLVLVSAVLMVFSGCATMEGVGKDVESAGEEIQEAARD